MLSGGYYCCCYYYYIIFIIQKCYLIHASYKTQMTINVPMYVCMYLWTGFIWFRTCQWRAVVSMVQNIGFLKFLSCYFLTLRTIAHEVNGLRYKIRTV